MNYTNEDIRMAGELFFKLLSKRILPATDVLATLYYDDNNIREILDSMADEGGLRIFGTRKNLHLVVRGEDSVFATTYTHMKEKYKKLDRKKHFYLANIIICIFLSEIDRENAGSFQFENQGVSYYKFEETISNTLESWKKRNDTEDSFSQDFAIAIDEIYSLWFVEMSHSKESSGDGMFSLSYHTRLGFIYEALKPLEHEGLIINLYRENMIIPKDELYERLENLYHGGDRYEEILSAIKYSKEDN